MMFTRRSRSGVTGRTNAWDGSRAKRKLIALIGAAVAVSALVIGPLQAAQAYAPTPSLLYQLPANTACLKGQSNCVVYPKAAVLPDGRLVASFEDSAVPSSGSAIGQTLPIYTSTDNGTTWQPWSSVPAPAYLSSAPQYAPYTSNWTNPYLYVLPQAVGNLAKGTLLLASVVSGQDDYYTEQKAANPNWTPTNDGDRQNVAIALFSSTNDGQSWSIVNIIATGGWQGGSAGASGVDVSTANTYKEVDPVWEPYLLVYNNQLVAYYSDENDYLGYNATTGVGTIDPNNATATDSYGQVISHRTWNGTSSSWSSTVIDVPGTTINMGGGKTEIGGGRPGMANVVETSDGKWMMTFEYWGGGATVHFKMSSSPLTFFSDGTAAGTDISNANGSQGPLPYAPGSQGLSWGGSPVLIALPDGRLVYNAGGSGNVWVDESGSSTGVWTEFQTTLQAGYSRNLTYDPTTGRVIILQGNWGTSSTPPYIDYGEVDLGNSAGTYYQIVNKLTGQVIGTNNNITDANLGNGNEPDVRLEAAGSAANPATELWHITTKADGNVTLINKSGGRAAEIWTGNATAGQQIGSWVDNTPNGLFTMYTKSNGYVYFQSVQSPSLYLTGSSTGANLTLEPSDNGAGSQDWQLVPAS